MSLQIKPAASHILTKLHGDILLRLCDFLDTTSLLNFSLTCKKYHQLINENELYWKLRYYKEFLPDDDWREGAWLTSYRRRTVPKQSTSTSISQPKTLKQKATRDWSQVNWRKAYYRRHIAYRHLIDDVWCERYCNLPVDPETASLCIIGMNARTTLISETDGTRIWAVRDSVISLGVEPEQLTWRELPLSTDTIGEVVSIFDAYTTDRYIILWCYIHFPVKSDKDDQSTEDIYKRKAIIAWDIQNINRTIPIYIQKDAEVRNDAPLPRLVRTYTLWILGFTRTVSDSQSDNVGHRYFIYDLDRESCHHFGPIYTYSGADIQTATEEYAHVITFHFNSDNMNGDKSSAIAEDKPASLRMLWQSYIFDNENISGLEDHNGEIIMPYRDNPMIYSQPYGPGLMMVMIYSAEDSEIHDDDTEPPVMLALVCVPEHSVPQNSISRCRRSRRDGAIGEVIWIQPIATNIVRPLYSQNLIVVQGCDRTDILSDTDGKIVRQIDCATYELLRPIIGPYFYLPDSNNDNFIRNVETGEKFQHHIKLPPLEKHHIATSVEDVHDPSSTDQPTNSLFTLTSWPYCNCIGQLAIHEPGHQNRFYLYSLSGF
jgi:hypothetical protein